MGEKDWLLPHRHVFNQEFLVPLQILTLPDGVSEDPLRVTLTLQQGLDSFKQATSFAADIKVLKQKCKGLEVLSFVF